MIRILLHGAGRMARRVIQQVKCSSEYELIGLVSRTEPDNATGLDYFATLEDFTGAADLLLDFTLPGGPGVAAQWCGQHGVALLSGTTGLLDEDRQALANAALQVPVMWASNLSRGVALMSSLVAQTAAELGASAAIKITDTHHQHKIDAPSGTALTLGAAVQAGLGEGSANEPVYASVREGEIIGEHSVTFEVAGEMLAITHHALDRDVFARGALRAAAWLVQQKPGYYTISDWQQSP